MTTVSVFGGTGFLGRRIVRRLAAEGATLRIAVRSPERAQRVFRAADLERATVLRADVRDEASVAAAVAGVDAVVNAVSAYVEKRGITFTSVHEQGAKTLAQRAAAAGVARLVLVSGIGADPQSRSAYIRARGRGELVVRQAFPSATIVRPSAMFGPGDALFGTLAEIVRRLPVVPLISAGRTRMQPVYVDDVAEAIARMLADPASAGRTYELAGPGVHTLRDLVRFALRVLGKRRLLLPVPLAVAAIQARLFELLPHPPLTTGQVDLLRADNLASGTLPGFRELNIRPKALEDVVPTYISSNRRV
jgi:NADH dehydrogenase